MAKPMNENLVTTQWLAQHIGSPDIIILDATWHMPAAKRDAKQEFLVSHILGAQFFDLDAASDQNTNLPHMLPSAEKFAHDLGVLGAGDGKMIICYDTVGLFSAARLWWMLKSFGHQQAAVLDGGMPKWRAENRAVEAGAGAKPERRPFTVSTIPGNLRSMVDVAAAITSGTSQIADARSPPRFAGEEAEPRPGVKPGHMHGAKNVHYATLLKSNGTLKSAAELRNVFEAAGLKLNQPIITTCGSGVTAAMLSLALENVGVKNHSLYDGSWTEWGASDQPVVTGR